LRLFAVLLHMDMDRYILQVQKHTLLHSWALDVTDGGTTDQHAWLLLSVSTCCLYVLYSRCSELLNPREWLDLVLRRGKQSAEFRSLGVSGYKMLLHYTCGVHVALASVPSTHCDRCERSIITPKTGYPRKINCWGMSEKSDAAEDPIYERPV
jgi:hypothetical protein